MFTSRQESSPQRVSRALRLCAALPLLLGVWHDGAAASAPPPHPRILLHLAPVTTRNACTWGTLASCTEAQTAGRVATPGGPGPFYYAYLLVDPGGLASVGGIQLGISYDGDTAGPPLNGQGVEVFHWELCTTFEGVSTGWPGSRGGDLIVWRLTDEPCATAPVPIAGYFYLGAYSPDRMRIIPRPVDNLAKATDCASQEHLIAETDLGSLNFTADGLTPGLNPCGSATPVRSMTWGGIKALGGTR